MYKRLITSLYTHTRARARAHDVRTFQ